MKANWITIGEALIISNVNAGDTTFDSDVGSWNVSRAARDCAAGKHKPYVFDVKATLAGNYSVTVNEAKARSNQMQHLPDRRRHTRDPRFLPTTPSRIAAQPAEETVSSQTAQLFFSCQFFRRQTYPNRSANSLRASKMAQPSTPAPRSRTFFPPPGKLTSSPIAGDQP